MQRHPRFCAIAQSLREKRDVLDVRVGAGIVYVVYPTKISRGILSKQDRRKVHDFDATGYFGPTTVTLLRPPPSTGRQPAERTRSRSKRPPASAQRSTRVPRPSLRHISVAGD